MEDTPNSRTVSGSHPGKGLWQSTHESARPGVFPGMGTLDKGASLNVPGQESRMLILREKDS